MAGVENQWAYATPVYVANQYRDLKAVKANINNASKSIATLLGVAIPENAAGVKIYHGGTVHYNPAGGASADNAAVPTGFTIYGGPDILQNVRLFAASSTDVSVVVFGIRAGEVATVTT